MVEPVQQVDFNGIQYSPITFEEFAGHTKYSLVGVPRYRWSNKPVVILATFSTRPLTYTRKDFRRHDRQMGDFAYLKPPSGGEAGPSISIGPAFDDAAWNKCKTLWQVYSSSVGGAEDAIPRFFFLGTIIFDRKVFRSHYLALDTILFANSHAADPAIPHHSNLPEFQPGQQKTDDEGRIISIKKVVDPLTLDPGI
jgi:hypothetical protein